MLCGMSNIVFLFLVSLIPVWAAASPAIGGAAKAIAAVAAPPVPRLGVDVIAHVEIRVVHRNSLS